MDNTADIICRLADLMARKNNRSVSTLSRLATSSGGTIQRLKQGKRITTIRAARAIRWFSQNWPSDLPWPEDIPRPVEPKLADPKKPLNKTKSREGASA